MQCHMCLLPASEVDCRRNECVPHTIGPECSLRNSQMDMKYNRQQHNIKTNPMEQISRKWTTSRHALSVTVRTCELTNDR